MTVKDIAEALMSFGEDCEPKPEEGRIKNSTWNNEKKEKHFCEITFFLYRTCYWSGEECTRCTSNIEMFPILFNESIWIGKYFPKIYSNGIRKITFFFWMSDRYRATYYGEI